MIAAGAGQGNPAGPAAGPGLPAPGPMPETVRVTADPAALRLQALADRCVQCGLCLPACPTYALEGLEPESPRGRIALARGLATGLLAGDASADRHLDQCLGCRRCEAVCPAGVPYGELLTLARAGQRERRGVPWRQRLAEALVARPRLRRAVFALYRRVFPALPSALRPLPRPPGRGAPAPVLATGAEVLVFGGCMSEVYEDAVRDALAGLLAALGLRATAPIGAHCCGSVHAHAGDLATAAALAGAAARQFPGDAPVLTLATGCEGAIRDALGARAVDALAFLAARADALTFRAADARIALHLPCTSRDAAPLRALLARVPGLEVVTLDAGAGCCGAAGSQQFTDAERAARFRAPLLAQAAASGATRVLSANLGCRLHLAPGTALPVEHPLEFLHRHLTVPTTTRAGGA